MIRNIKKLMDDNMFTLQDFVSDAKYHSKELLINATSTIIKNFFVIVYFLFYIPVFIFFLFCLIFEKKLERKTK